MEVNGLLASRFGSIFPVADNRMASGAELGPNLVIAPRFQLDPDKGGVGLKLQDLIAEAGMLGLFVARLGEKGFVLGVDEIVVEAPLFLGENSFDFRHIKALDFLIARLLVKTAESLAGAGKKDKTANRFVEAVNRMEENSARFVVLGLDPSFGKGFERIAARFIGLREKARWLLGDQEVVIAVNDGAV